jgi:hypothetical protein
MEIRVLHFAPAGGFEWRWPSGNVEHFDCSWCGRIAIDGADFQFRHSLGHRHVYGKTRVHSVTWLAGAPMVEGVEADDYRYSHALISRLLRDDKKHARTSADIPSFYDKFLIVDHRSEISARYSPRSFAIKIVEDNVAGWATHAAIRAGLLRRTSRVRPRKRSLAPVITQPGPNGTSADPHKILTSC